MARAWQDNPHAHALILPATPEAVACFWGRLGGFVALGVAPRGWAGVPAVHPFLARSAQGLLVLTGP